MIKKFWTSFPWERDIWERSFTENPVAFFFVISRNDVIIGVAFLVAVIIFVFSGGVFDFP